MFTNRLALLESSGEFCLCPPNTYEEAQSVLSLEVDAALCCAVNPRITTFCEKCL